MVSDKILEDVVIAGMKVLNQNLNQKEQEIYRLGVSLGFRVSEVYYLVTSSLEKELSKTIGVDYSIPSAKRDQILRDAVQRTIEAVLKSNNIEASNVN